MLQLHKWEWSISKTISQSKTLSGAFNIDGIHSVLSANMNLKNDIMVMIF